MAFFKVLVTIFVMVTLAAAQDYYQPSYPHPAPAHYQPAPAPYQPAPYPAPAPSYGGGYSAPSYENYGPDSAQYYYVVENYDPYLYKNAYLNFNRYPGGAAYQLTEEGKGSHVNVNVETHKAGYGGSKGY